MANDLWRTPPWLFNWLNDLYGPFDVDLAARADNTLCSNYYDVLTDSLSQDWKSQYTNGFCNPPYSNLPPWFVKARFQNLCGFKSTWVLPAWNGDKHWRANVYENATKHVIQIYGRVGFTNLNGKPIPGNRTGTVIAHYPGQPFTGPAHIIHVDRDDLIKRYT